MSRKTYTRAMRGAVLEIQGKPVAGAPRVPGGDNVASRGAAAYDGLNAILRKRARKSGDPDADRGPITVALSRDGGTAINRDERQAAPMKRSPFASFGEQLRAIAFAFGDVPRVDDRLVRAMGELDPSTGGFAVSEQWTQELVGIAYEEATLAPMCDRRQLSAPLASVNVPGIDETSRATGSRWGGVVSYWSTEAATVTPSLPKFKNLNFSGKKLIVAVVVSNELLNDLPMLEAHVRRALTAELAFVVDWAILRGDGAGKPLGLLNSTALISIGKETGQASATIVAANVRKMWSRMPAPSRRRCVWLINEDAEEQLDQMLVTAGSAGSAAPTANALYMPAGAGGNEFPLLKGRPVLTLEQCSVLGSVGDIVLADLQHYVLIDGGVKPALSADCNFLEDQAVFRFTLRLDGQSAFSSAITSYNGSSNTRSPFVALAAR